MPENKSLEKEDLLKLESLIDDHESNILSATFDTTAQMDFIKKLFRYSNKTYIKPQAVYKMFEEGMLINRLPGYLKALKAIKHEKRKIDLRSELEKTIKALEMQGGCEDRITELKIEVRRLKKLETPKISRGYAGFDAFVNDLDKYLSEPLRLFEAPPPSLGRLKDTTPDGIKDMARDWKEFSNYFNSPPQHSKAILKGLIENELNDSYFDNLYREA